MQGAAGAVQNFSSASALRGWQGRVEGGEPERVQGCYRSDSCLRRRGGRERPICPRLQQRKPLPQGPNHHHEHPHSRFGPPAVAARVGWTAG